jgi:hypothetical protein
MITYAALKNYPVHIRKGFSYLNGLDDNTSTAHWHLKPEIKAWCKEQFGYAPLFFDPDEFSTDFPNFACSYDLIVAFKSDDDAVLFQVKWL